jgi:hypothetical protein
VAGTNTTQIATTAYVRTEVANLVNSAPGALDTLDELAAALGDDASFATTVTTAIGLKAPLDSPTFTGTVSGITKTMVGLGNVLNETKATMFTSPTFTGSVTISGGTITGITDLAVADGGTGASSITANSVILGNGTSALSGNLVAPGTAGNVLTSNGTTWTSSAPATPFSWNVTYINVTVAENGTYTLPANCIQVNGYVDSRLGFNTGSQAKIDIRNAANTILNTIFAGLTSVNDGGGGGNWFIPFSLPISSDANNIRMTKSSGGNTVTLYITSYVTRA